MKLAKETYDTPVQLAKQSRQNSPWAGRATLYADDGAAEIVKEFKSGTLSLASTISARLLASVLTGATIDDNKVLISGGEVGGTPVAIGFRAKEVQRQIQVLLAVPCKFGIPATNLATKGDSITFSLHHRYRPYQKQGRCQRQASLESRSH